MRAQEFKFTPLEQKVIALGLVGVLERNNIKDHGVSVDKMALDLAIELSIQAGELISSEDINDHVANEMKALIPLFSEGYHK
ncbi:hypothetical protein [Bacillus cereus]|uniref:Phage protein n=1 Tax=Bacillus cereus TIAC219 TaxID=718222 RepID=A0ABC9SQG8_BACCE|nr:hypothetical protein [Bacillus cereus]EJP81095.1 hypothetical protein IC1_06676 [Bacillus cereus VD022]EOQ57874.1 hypothetical protein IAY_06212 [Bacillus cereus TIAC219]